MLRGHRVAFVAGGVGEVVLRGGHVQRGVVVVVLLDRLVSVPVADEVGRAVVRGVSVWRGTNGLRGTICQGFKKEDDCNCE